MTTKSWGAMLIRIGNTFAGTVDEGGLQGWDHTLAEVDEGHGTSSMLDIVKGWTLSNCDTPTDAGCVRVHALACRYSPRIPGGAGEVGFESLSPRPCSHAWQDQTE
jgi:hypothetical protein